jgi:hypothetical protein
MSDKEDLISQIIASAKKTSIYDLEAMFPPRTPRTLLTLNRKCAYGGSLSVSLIEERPSADSVKYYLTCTPASALVLRELEARRLVSENAKEPARFQVAAGQQDPAEVAWRSEVPAEEAEEIMSLLERTPVPVVPQPLTHACDGCTYELLIERGMNSSAFHWWEQTPKGWEGLQAACGLLIKRAEMEASRRQPEVIQRPIG